MASIISLFKLLLDIETKVEIVVYQLLHKEPSNQMVEQK